MKLVFDIEANGLYHTVEKVWCICLQAIGDTESPVETFYDIPYGMGAIWKEQRTGTLSDGLKRLKEADELIGHNIINYDIPVLKKIFNWEPKENVKTYDTLVVSRVLNPDRVRPSGYTGKGGPHSLECWGYRTSKSKPKHEDWSVFNPAMLRRCIEDVGINVLTHNSLEVEREGWDWDEAIALEHSIAKIITQQEINGVLFDEKRARECCDYLGREILEIDSEVVPRLPCQIKQRGATVMEPFTKTGEHTKRYREDISYCSGPFTRIDFIPFDLGSIQQVKSYLLENGWRPEFYNYSNNTGEKSSPKLEGEFRGVEGDLPKKVRKRILYRHRKSQIEGWLNNIRTDGRLTASANPCGTNTGRMRQSGVVNVPKANSDDKGKLIWELDKQKDYFGTQMRSLFITPPHYKMVGHDAKGLELRMLAHYMNDPKFTEEILNGDIHTFNQRLAGLSTRDQAKTFIYAFIYGAGDQKLAATIGCTIKEIKQIRRKFLEALPALDSLIRTTRKNARAGYLIGLDGRKIWLRRDSNGEVMVHKALNTLLQCGGSLVMKKSSQILWEHMLPKNLKIFKVIDMHDESQAEVHRLNVELYSEMAVESVRKAGEYFNLNIPMDADVKIGSNWAETH